MNEKHQLPVRLLLYGRFIRNASASRSSAPEHEHCSAGVGDLPCVYIKTLFLVETVRFLSYKQ